MKARFLLGCGSWLLLGTVGCVSMNAAPPSYHTAESMRAWTKQKWTQDDAPYRRVRVEIDSTFDKTRSDQMLSRYRAAALAQPRGDVARFRWGYYAYRMSTSQTTTRAASGKFSKLPQTLVVTPTPNSYEFIRMRFLVESAMSERGPHMAELGARLLQRNPKDHRVMFHQVSNLFTGREEDEQRALKLARQLVAVYPQRPNPHALLAYVHKRRWWGYHKREDAQASAANYRKYLRLAKLDPVGRRRIENSIKEMENAK